MKQRNPFAVFFLFFITFGIYGIVWEVKTKNEMNRLGAQIPTAWLLIIPFVNWYWLWKYSEGVEHATGGKTSAILAFILMFLLGAIGAAILQNEFNKVDGTASAAPFGAPVPGPAPIAGPPQAPVAPVAPVAPAAPAAPPVPAAPPQTPQTQTPTPPPSEPTNPTPPTATVG